VTLPDAPESATHRRRTRRGGFLMAVPAGWAADDTNNLVPAKTY